MRPGKVAWDWWNCFDNQGNDGCNTKTYERFIDFAARTGVDYVIFDEGWSETLNIWKFHKNVDVPHLIDYANRKGVGIILWMAWAQVYGDEEKVASHFAKLGAKGFKVDFMDRGDADVERFLWTFADEAAPLPAYPRAGRLSLRDGGDADVPVARLPAGGESGEAA